MVHDRLVLARRGLLRQAERLERKLEKQRGELLDTEKAEWFRQIGESLLAMPHGIGRGPAKALILNVYTQTQENVSLNPSLDLHENAGLYFKKARKAARGHGVNVKKVEQTERQLNDYKAIEAKCSAALALLEARSVAPGSEETAQLADLLATVEAAIQKNGPRAQGVQAPVDETGRKIPYRHFSMDGWNIYIGKNDTQNDELTTRFARPYDLWFHAAGHAGSHVIIRLPNRTAEVPHQVLQSVAALAAWFSKAKHASYVEVHMTESRFVRKRRHAPPGEVIAERCRTIRVSPRSPQDLFPAEFDSKE